MYDVLGSNGHILHRKLSELVRYQTINGQESARDGTGSKRPFPYVEIQGVNDSYFVIESITKQYFDSHELYKCPSNENPELNVIESQQEDNPRQGISSVAQAGVIKIMGRHKYDKIVTEDIQESDEDIVDPPRQGTVLPANFLQSLRGELEELSILQLTDLIASFACIDIENTPHDISVYICLHLIYAKRYFLTKSADDKEKVINVLRTSLDIINHSNAVGMFGWIDYGKSQVLDRSLERPFQTLSDVAIFFVMDKDWSEAIRVFQSLVLRCEQHLPLYHPISISAMLDLAASFYNVGEHKRAMKFSQKAGNRVAIYLREQEHGSRQNTSDKSSEEVCSKHVSMLHAFASQMRAYSRRKMMNILDTNHPIKLLHHCFLGDSLSVLATCQKRVSQLKEIDSSYEDDIALSWKLAADCYRFALKGWVKSHGFYHPNVPSTSYSFARCLRELGFRDDASKVLSVVVHSRKTFAASNPFHNHSGSKNALDVELCLRYHKSVAICTRYMALLTLESRPNEEGRMKAIRLLKCGAEKLQIEIELKRGTKNIDLLRQSCWDILKILQEDENNLTKPLKEMTEKVSNILEEREDMRTFVSV